VCCSVLQGVEAYRHNPYHTSEGVMRVAKCYRVLQCVAVCCSVLQCVAVCCSVLQPASITHVTHLKESCHTGDGVKSHVRYEKCYI